MIQASFRGHTVRTKHSMAVEVGYRRARRRAQAKARPVSSLVAPVPVRPRDRVRVVNAVP
eukprot:31136-Pelagococcus_subviridis.AAC.2